MFDRHSILPLHVIKIGGSLLANASSRSAIENAEQWIAEQSNSINIVVVGGGRGVDHLRRWQRQFNLDELQSHLNSVQVMSLNTSKLAQSSCISTVIANWKALTDFVGSENVSPTTIMFDCFSFLQNVEPTLSGIALATDWSCTSDSIAARIAQLLGADKLTLLKSRTACCSDLQTLQYANYVDLSFPQMAADIKAVTFVDCSS